MLVSSLVTEISTYDLQDSSNDNWASAELISYLNRFFSRLHSKLIEVNSDFAIQSTTKTIAAGKASLALSSLATNVWVVTDMVASNETQAMSKVNFNEITLYDAKYGTGNGIPKVYCVHNTKVYVRPRSDGRALTIMYAHWWSPLASTGTIPWYSMFIEPCREYIVMRALNRDEYTVDMENAIFADVMAGFDYIQRKRNAFRTRAVSQLWRHQGKV